MEVGVGWGRVVGGGGGRGSFSGDAQGSDHVSSAACGDFISLLSKCLCRRVKYSSRYILLSVFIIVLLQQQQQHHHHHQQQSLQQCLQQLQLLVVPALPPAAIIMIIKIAIIIIKITYCSCYPSLHTMTVIYVSFYCLLELILSENLDVFSFPNCNY